MKNCCITHHIIDNLFNIYFLAKLIFRELKTPIPSKPQGIQRNPLKCFSNELKTPRYSAYVQTLIMTCLEWLLMHLISTTYNHQCLLWDTLWFHLPAQCPSNWLTNQQALGYSLDRERILSLFVVRQQL